MSTAEIIARALLKIAIIWSPAWGGTLGYVLVTRTKRGAR